MYKQDFTRNAMKVAHGLTSGTEKVIKEYIEKNKAARFGLLEPLLTDAERNSYLASETNNQYSGTDNRRDLSSH